IFQTPGANAIKTLNDVRARVAELAQSFPDDMAWKVTYDPTASVTATIEEVQKTLIEAFILVVIVVYLFLGSVRATLIPTIAVPGISGELLRQVAVTVSVSMLLAAINACTLPPALCGVLLRPHHGPRRGPIGWVIRSIDKVRDGYGAAVARMVRFSVIGLAMV